MIKLLAVFVALIFFNNAISQSDTEYFIKSKVEIYYNNIDSAIKLVSKSIEINSKSDYLLQRAEYYIVAKKHTEAINDLLRVDESNNNRNYKLAQCYSKLNDWQNAESYLKKYLLSANKFSENIVKTDSAFIVFKTTKNWEDIWKSNWFNEYENNIAEIYYLSKKSYPQDIFDLLETSIKKYPNSDELWFWRAKAFLFWNNEKEVLNSYNKAIEINPDRTDIIELRADLFMKSNKFVKAISDYSTILLKSPTDIYIYYKKALAEIKNAQYSNAIKDILTYQKYYYKDSKSLNIAGKAAYNNKDLQIAINLFNKSLEINNSSDETYFELGKCYLDENKLDTAFNYFCSAIDINPNNGEYFYYRGLNYFELKNNIGACSDWEKAKNLDYLQAEQYMLRICNNK